MCITYQYSSKHCYSFLEFHLICFEHLEHTREQRDNEPCPQATILEKDAVKLTCRCIYDDGRGCLVEADFSKGQRYLFEAEDSRVARDRAYEQAVQDNLKAQQRKLEKEERKERVNRRKEDNKRRRMTEKTNRDLEEISQTIGEYAIDDTDMGVAPDGGERSATHDNEHAAGHGHGHKRNRSESISLSELSSLSSDWDDDRPIQDLTINRGPAPTEHLDFWFQYSEPELDPVKDDEGSPSNGKQSDTSSSVLADTDKSSSESCSIPIELVDSGDDLPDYVSEVDHNLPDDDAEFEDEVRDYDSDDFYEDHEMESRSRYSEKGRGAFYDSGDDADADTGAYDSGSEYSNSEWESDFKRGPTNTGRRSLHYEGSSPENQGFAQPRLPPRRLYDPAPVTGSNRLGMNPYGMDGKLLHTPNVIYGISGERDADTNMSNHLPGGRILRSTTRAQSHGQSRSPFASQPTQRTNSVTYQSGFVDDDDGHTGSVYPEYPAHRSRPAYTQSSSFRGSDRVGSSLGAAEYGNSGSDTHIAFHSGSPSQVGQAEILEDMIDTEKKRVNEFDDDVDMD